MWLKHSIWRCHILPGYSSSSEALFCADSGADVEEEDPELAAALAASLADSQTSAGPSAASEEDLHAAQLATLDPGSEPSSGPGISQ